MTLNRASRFQCVWYFDWGDWKDTVIERQGKQEAGKELKALSKLLISLCGRV